MVLAVSDHAITPVSAILARDSPGVPVLHASGATEVAALEPLARAGCPVGGLHPLAAATSPEALRGVWWGVEGDGPARQLATRIVAAADGRVLEIPAGARPLYHAAAVLASNALVALLGTAERVMARAGVENARPALAALAGGTLRAVADQGPAEALTGPIARGDAETVRAHLERLSPDERAVYCALGREALALARGRGLDPAAATILAHLLGDSP